jgi:hypothetical protein
LIDANRVCLEDLNGKKSTLFMGLILIFGNSNKQKEIPPAVMEFMMTKMEYVTNIKE